MLKCAASAADYNQRLVRNRPISFLDLHTNVEQVSAATQPTRVRVQQAMVDTNVRYVRARVSLEDGDEEGWTTVSAPGVSLFPLALMRSQRQDSYAVYVFTHCFNRR